MGGQEGVGRAALIVPACKGKGGKKSVAEEYRRILGMRNLKSAEIELIRRHVQSLAQAICEHIWGKKLH
jgi:hypothetical protein